MPRSDSEEQASARLGIRQQNFPNLVRACPIHGLPSQFQIVPGAAWNAAFRDQSVNLFVEQREGPGIDEGRDVAGATHGSEMPR